MMVILENILYIYQQVMMAGIILYYSVCMVGEELTNDFINTNDMRPIADTAGFIAIYPQAAIDPDDSSFSNGFIRLQLLIMIYSSLKQLLIRLVLNI